ncbi:MAG: hypothetical protein M1840_005052 [Geoglossum simile]|nr:MAG: hypothetical protein M1840_005052 [Geoglossum simile]
MSSGVLPGHSAGIASQFEALNLNGPNGARPRPSGYPAVVDVGSHQARGQVTNKKNHIYLGVSLIRHRRPGAEPTWRYAERRRLLFPQEELAERAKKRKASKVYRGLPPNMRNQVDSLVEDENRQNPDQAFEWILVAIDTDSARLGRIDVILRSDPNPRAVLRSDSSYSGMMGNPNAGGYPGAAQERGPINPDPRGQAFQGRPPIPSPMPPPPPPPPHQQQQQQQQKQGVPPQKQHPTESFGGGILGNGNQFPPAPPPPPPPPPLMMQAMPPCPPPPPPPPQPQQKMGQNLPFNMFDQGPSMPQHPPHQGIPQQKNQQQRPQPPPQGGQNIPPNQPPRQKPIVEQYGQQNQSHGFRHQSYPKVDSPSQRREDLVSPWLEGDGIGIYDEYSSDETEFTLPSTEASEYTYNGSSPSRSNSMKMGKHPERGSETRADNFLAKPGSRSPRTSPYRHHRRESTDLDYRSLDEPRDGQHNHRHSRRYSYDDENIHPGFSRGRDLMAVGPRAGYTEDDIEIISGPRRAREGYTRYPHHRRPSHEYSEIYPRGRHTMHCRHHGCDDDYCTSPSPRSRPAVVYGPRRTSEYLPYTGYSRHSVYDPRER